VEHLSSEVLNKFISRKLDVAWTLYADRHLANCNDCRQRMITAMPANNSYLSFLSKFRESANQRFEHISYEQLSDYVKGELTAIGRENVESHAGLCHLCSKELSDLQAFVFSLNAETVNEKDNSLVGNSTKKNGKGAFFFSPRFIGVFGVLAILLCMAGLLVYLTTVSREEKLALGNMKELENSPLGIRKQSDSTSKKEPVSSLIFKADGKEKTLVIPKDTKTIFLKFGIANAKFKEYKASIKNTNTKDELTKLALDALEDRSADYFTMSFSADMLIDGDYKIVVTGVNDKGEITKIKEYLIKVIKEK